jgi:hypothetical protein
VSWRGRLAALLPDRAFDALVLLRAHRRRLGAWPRPHAPRGFNDWMLRRLLLAREARHREWNDKLALRRFVAGRVGEQHLVPLVAVAESAEALDWHALPRAFAIKPSHSSGRCILVRDRDTADRSAILAAARAWLGECYYAGTDGRGGSREWGYRGIARRLIVEELLPLLPDFAAPMQLNAYTFGGRIAIGRKFTLLADGTKAGQSTDADWNPLPFAINRPVRDPFPRPPPEVRARMAWIAERLGHDADFLRIDCYVLPDGRVLVGELTPYPHAGRAIFEPPEWGLWLGAVWRATRRGEAAEHSAG